MGKAQVVPGQHLVAIFGNAEFFGDGKGGKRVVARNHHRTNACFFGDGAACEGSFHESLNLAALWNLPILYICENNQWQAFVHRREAMSRERVSDWAAAYGIPTRTVDGNDVMAVLDAASGAAAQVRESGRPVLLTNRFVGCGGGLVNAGRPSPR